jgi:hypothetical protein
MGLAAFNRMRREQEKIKEAQAQTPVDDLESKSYEDLKVIATDLKIEFAGNIGKTKLIEKIKEAQAQ